jgi:hypothetical protein
LRHHAAIVAEFAAALARHAGAKACVTQFKDDIDQWVMDVAPKFGLSTARR